MTKKRISKGYKYHTNLGCFKKGQIPWNKNLKKESLIEIRKCKCGCGKDVSGWNYHKKMPIRYVRGHGISKLNLRPIKGKTFEEVHGKEIAKIMIEKKLGKNNPNWNSGSSFELYGLEFNKKLKNEIRKRDNQICMNCGIHREKLKEALTIHHINYDKQCNLFFNLISLCRKCHGLTQGNRPYWKKLFQEKLSKFYNYKYSENGDIILNIQEVK